MQYRKTRNSIYVRTYNFPIQQIHSKQMILTTMKITPKTILVPLLFQQLTQGFRIGQMQSVIAYESDI